jgi:hypothetical protein
LMPCFNADGKRKRLNGTPKMRRLWARMLLSIGAEKNGRYCYTHMHI